MPRPRAHLIGLGHSLGVRTLSVSSPWGPDGWSGLRTTAQSPEFPVLWQVELEVCLDAGSMLLTRTPHLLLSTYSCIITRCLLSAGIGLRAGSSIVNMITC